MTIASFEIAKSGLILPAEPKVGATDIDGKPHYDDPYLQGIVDYQPPDGMCIPFLYRALIKAFAREQSKGGVLLTQASVDDQEWFMGLGKVVAVGPCFGKGPQFDRIGVTPDMLPKAGDIVLFDARQCSRLRRHGEKFLTATENEIKAIVSPWHLDGYEYAGLKT